MTKIFTRHASSQARCSRRIAAALIAVSLPVFGHAAAGPEPVSIFSIGDHGRRQTALVTELASLDAAAMAAWAKKIDEAPPCAARDEDRLVVVEFWGQADPHAARAYVDARRTSEHSHLALQEALLHGWTRADADAAWAWSQDQPAKNELDLPKVVIETAAEFAPEKGLAWATVDIGRAPQDSPEAGVASERAFGFFRKLTDIGDYETCRTLIEKFPAGELRGHLFFFIADRMSTYALSDTAAWTRTLTGADALPALAAVAAQWSHHDPDAALDWVLATEDTAARVKLVRVAAAETVSRDPSLARAEHILAKLKTPADRQAAYGAFAGCEDLVHLAPARMLDWAAEIEDGNDRVLSLIRGYGIWYDFDRPKAEAHFKTAKLSQHDRDQLQKFFQGGDKTP